jgi:hypothetical protein
MNLWIRTKAKIDKKHPELCSWGCPRLCCVNMKDWACNAFHNPRGQRGVRILKYVTLPNGKEMLRRCRECRSNTLRVA